MAHVLVCASTSLFSSPTFLSDRMLHGTMATGYQRGLLRLTELSEFQFYGADDDVGLSSRSVDRFDFLVKLSPRRYLPRPQGQTTGENGRSLIGFEGQVLGVSPPRRCPVHTTCLYKPRDGNVVAELVKPVVG